MDNRVYKLLRNFAILFGVIWLGWEAYNSLFNTTPGDTEFLAADRFFEDGDYDRARESYKASLEKAPNQVFALRGLARSLMQLGRDEDALAVFNEAISREPDFAATYANRGILYDRMGRYRQALADSIHGAGGTIPPIAHPAAPIVDTAIALSERPVAFSREQCIEFARGKIGTRPIPGTTTVAPGVTFPPLPLAVVPRARVAITSHPSRSRLVDGPNVTHPARIKGDFDDRLAHSIDKRALDDRLSDDRWMLIFTSSNHGGRKHHQAGDSHCAATRKSRRHGFSLLVGYPAQVRISVTTRAGLTPVSRWSSPWNG